VKFPLDRRSKSKTVV